MAKRCLLSLLLLAGLSTAGPAGQSPAALRDVAALGPRVGERVPDFSLPDQAGRLRRLADLMGPNGLVLVFFRSADW
jgi:hypothetical protein